MLFKRMTMNLVEWKSLNNKPDALISWLSKNSIVNGAKNDIKVDNFFTTSVDNFLFSEAHCLVEFFEFNIKTDVSVRNKIIIDSIKELILKKRESSDNLLELVTDKIQLLSFHKEKKYCLTSISAEKIPYRTIQVFNSKINFYKEFPIFFQSRKLALQKKHQKENNQYTKCVITSITESNEISEHMNNLDIFRAVINILINNSWGMVFHTNPEPINKIRLGKFHTLHKEDGEFSGCYYEQKYTTAPLADLSNLPKKRIEKNLRLIKKCKYKEVIIESLLLYTKALDEWDLNMSLLLLWSALEKLLCRDGMNESYLYKHRCSIIFPHEIHIGECIDSLRWIRNKFVHNYDNHNEARTLTYQLKNIFRGILAYHLSKKFTSFDLAMKNLDSSNYNI